MIRLTTIFCCPPELPEGFCYRLPYVLLIDFNIAWHHKRSYCKSKALFAEGIISSWFLQEINKKKDTE
jgi:hypothetical protein